MTATSPRGPLQDTDCGKSMDSMCREEAPKWERKPDFSYSF